MYTLETIKNCPNLPRRIFMEYYDDEMRDGIAKLTKEDRLRLMESLFNAMTSSMRAFYLSAGHSDREIQMLINTEIKGVKELIRNRVSELDAVDIAVDEKVSESSEPTKSVTDDQMVNDAMIDLGLILKEFGVKPE